MPKKPSQRGGRRPGAGRKPLPEGQARVSISASVAPTTPQRLAHLAYQLRDLDGNLATVGAVIDWLVRDVEAED